MSFCWHLGFSCGALYDAPGFDEGSCKSLAVVDVHYQTYRVFCGATGGPLPLPLSSITFFLLSALLLTLTFCIVDFYNCVDSTCSSCNSTIFRTLTYDTCFPGSFYMCDTCSVYAQCSGAPSPSPLPTPSPSPSPSPSPFPTPSPEDSTSPTPHPLPSSTHPLLLFLSLVQFPFPPLPPTG